jgi:hypothetical protein
MASLKRLFIFPAIFIAATGFAQTTNPAKDSSVGLIGSWKGTSICQVKPSPCNDEIAVYHIIKEIKPGIYHLVGNKLVNGKEEEMGEFDFSFSAADSTLTYIDEKRNFIIKLMVKGSTMEGILVSNSVIYRIIKLAKQQ